MKQVGEVDRLGKVVPPSVSIDILPQQIDFLDASLCETRHLGNHIIHRTGHFLAACVGHHTEGAVLAAALHDRDEGCRPFNTGLGQAIKFFDFRKADIDDHWLALTMHVNHFRQTVQCLWSKYQIDVGCPLSDFCALLTGNTAAYADNQIGVLLFQVLPAPQLVEDLLLRLFSNRTRVEQQNVGFIG